MNHNSQVLIVCGLTLSNYGTCLVSAVWPWLLTYWPWNGSRVSRGLWTCARAPNVGYFCRAMLCKRGLSRHAVYVCVSVTFVGSVKTNKRIFNFFSPLGSHTIPAFPHQKAWPNWREKRHGKMDGNPPNGGLECRCGRQKSRFRAYICTLRPILLLLVCVSLTIIGQPRNSVLIRRV